MYNNYQGIRTERKKVTQPLTQEDVKALNGHNGLVSMAITKNEQLCAMCTHKQLDSGENAIIEEMTPSGPRFYCSICGTEFKFITDPEILREKISGAIDALESIKYMGTNLPNKFVSEYFIIIALLKKAINLANPVVSTYMKDTQNNASVQYRPGNEDIFSAFAEVSGDQGYYNPRMYQPDPSQGYSPSQGYNPQMYNQRPPQGYNQNPQQDFSNLENYYNPMGYNEQTKSVIPPITPTPVPTDPNSSDNSETVTERVTV